MDIQNLLNYAAYSNPSTDPTNTNFGKVTTAVAAAGAMRFFNFAATVHVLGADDEHRGERQGRSFR